MSTFPLLSTKSTIKVILVLRIVSSRRSVFQRSTSDGGINATLYRSHIHLKNKLRCFLKYPPHYSSVVCSFLFLFLFHFLSSYLPISFTCSPTFITVFFIPLTPGLSIWPSASPVLLHLTPFLYLYYPGYRQHTLSLLCFTIIPTCGLADCANRTKPLLRYL